MRILITLLFTITGLFAATSLLAQTYGVRAGFNMSNLDLNSEFSEIDEFELKPGYHVGATANIPISKLFSIETGLILSTKGTKQEQEPDTGGATFKVEDKINLVYLDIPITGKITNEIGGTKVYCLLGPYAALGLTGKTKSEVTSAGVTSKDETDINFGGDEFEDDLKRFDFGLIGGVGLEIQAFEVGLSYSLGLTNIAHSIGDELSIKNRVFSLSVGYKFGQ